ncbi:MAG: hypothetical protein HYY93_14040 [Planctomycetes bacterium]|nr:hypothetical protein [Planctomycetota bacterium]
MRRTDTRGIAMVWLILMVTLACSAVIAWFYLLAQRGASREEQARLTAKTSDLQAEAELVQRHSNLLRDRGGCQETGDADPAPVKELRDRKKETYKLLQANTTLEDVAARSSERLFLAEMSLSRAQYEEKCAQKSLAAAKEFYNDVDRKKSDLISSLQNVRTEVNSKVDAQRTLLDGRITELQDIRDKADADRQEATNKHNARLLRLNNDLIRAKSTVEGFRRKEAVVREIIEIQGHLMHPDATSGFAYIDLGENEEVRPGLKFRVLRPDVAGTRRLVGEVEVKRVFEHMSEVSMTRTLDWRNPMIEGDLIANPFYRKGRAVRVALAGKFTPDVSRFSREEAARRIERSGAAVETKPSVYTDFVIIGSEVEGDPTFDTAAQIGVPVVRAVDIQDYLGD